MFNIQALLYQLLASLTSYKGDWNDVKQVAEEYFETTKHRLADVAEARLLFEKTNGEQGIDNVFMVARLKEELTILESQLLSFTVIGKSEAQELINGVIETFSDVIQKAIEKAK